MVPWRYPAAAVVVLLAGIGVGLVGTWQVLAAVAGGTTLPALLETALAYPVALAVLALVEVVVVVAALVKMVRAVSSEDIGSDRLRAAVARVRRRLSV